MEIERRSFPIRDMRAKGDNHQIAGYAAVFNELSQNLGGFYEKIEPGAFSRTIESADVRALWNHDPNYPLGRTKAGTLRLAEDGTGLSFEIDPPDTSYARDLLVSMGRGDVDQMSFGFHTVRDRWEQIGDTIVRTLLEVDLFDVSPVTYPAYPQTSAAVRSAFEEFTTAMKAGAGAAENTTDGDKAQVRNKLRNLSLKCLQALGE